MMKLEDLLQDDALLQCRVNGKLVEELVPGDESLLDFLRERLRLTGTHMGCKTGHCGACSVLIDGKVAKSCLCIAPSVDGCKVTTIEGIAYSDGELSILQAALDEVNAFQCGFCAPGMILAAVELLAENKEPRDTEIRQALSGNLCRCTGYRSIVRGIQLAAERMRNQSLFND